MIDPDIRTVTKRELVNRIAEDTDLTKVVVRDVLQRFLDAIVDELAEGNRLEFREFGVFEVRERAARTAQNPRTLEKVPVPAKKVVKFKVGRMMRTRVCEDLGDLGAAADGGSKSARGGREGSTGTKPAGESASTTNENGNGKRPQPPTPPPTKPGSPF